jgi:ABC-type transport system involved in multi-copper enzyme maturation permease subunit
LNFQQINPIVLREMRGRMRSRRTFLGLTGYAGFLSALTGIIYASFVNFSSEFGQSYGDIALATSEMGPYLGKSIFSGLVILMLIMLPFTAAALAADAIAGERERQTYEMLRITSMSTQRLVWGKLGAVLSLLGLYILVIIPLLSFAFLFGGVAFGELVIALIGLVATALGFGAWGLFVSSMAKSTKMATAVSSSLILLIVYAGPFLLWLAVMIVGPLIAIDLFDTPDLVSISLIYLGGFIISLNPLGAALLTGAANAAGYNYFVFSLPGPPATLWVVSPWLVYVAFYLLLTWLLMRLTIRRLAKLSEV